MPNSLLHPLKQSLLDKGMTEEEAVEHLQQLRKEAREHYSRLAEILDVTRHEAKVIHHASFYETRNSK